jgi:hypothetical protein
LFRRAMINHPLLFGTSLALPSRLPFIREKSRSLQYLLETAIHWNESSQVDKRSSRLSSPPNTLRK